MANVTVDLRNLQAIEEFTRKQALPAEVKRQWVFRYRTFIQARFVLFSRGGGDWPPLKRSTLLARARRTVGRAREQNDVARDTETDAQRAKRLRAAKARYGREKKRIDSGQAQAAILRDTGVLFAALNPRFLDAPGFISEEIPFGVRVGYGGPSRHDTEGGAATIADIAGFHQTGAGRLPVRKIIVPPDQATIEAMKQDLLRAMFRRSSAALK